MDPERAKEANGLMGELPRALRGPAKAGARGNAGQAYRIGQRENPRWQIGAVSKFGQNSAAEA